MDRHIDVCWHAQEDGRGRYNSTAMVNDMFDRYNCRHHGAWHKMPDVDGAVVVVHGGRELGRFEKLQSDIEPLKWCILIYLGDEESSFPAEQIKHSNSISWVQEPIPGRHDFAKRSMVNGYGHEAHSYIQRGRQCDKGLWNGSSVDRRLTNGAARSWMRSVLWTGAVSSFDERLPSRNLTGRILPNALPSSHRALSIRPALTGCSSCLGRYHFWMYPDSRQSQPKSDRSKVSGIMYLAIIRYRLSPIGLHCQA